MANPHSSRHVARRSGSENHHGWFPQSSIEKISPPPPPAPPNTTSRATPSPLRNVPSYALNGCDKAGMIGGQIFVWFQTQKPSEMGPQAIITSLVTLANWLALFLWYLVCEGCEAKYNPFPLSILAPLHCVFSYTLWLFIIALEHHHFSEVISSTYE